MKVLVIGMSDNPGGIESFIEAYYNEMKNTISFDFMVFTKSCVNYDKLISNGSKVFFIKHAQFKDYFNYDKEMKSFFREHGKSYDAIWVNCCDLANSSILSYAKKAGIKKRIIHAHNNQFMQSGKRLLFYKFMHNIMKIRISNLATDFWACSDLAGQFFYSKKLLKSNKYKVINNAIDISSFKFNQDVRNEYRKKYGLEDKIVLGHVGRFHFQKNQSFLIDIFNEIIKLDNNYHLLLVGQGDDEEKIKRKVNCLKLDNHVTFLGVRDDVFSLMQAMDIFVFPSIFEGLGIVLIEAQATGLPCFTSNKVVPRDVRITELLKFINLEDNPQEWAKYIKECKLNGNRKESYKDIRNAGFDIKVEASKVKKLLMEE